MKPRTRKTYPILAVAAAAATCGGMALSEASGSELGPATPPVDEGGYPLVGNLVRKGDGKPQDGGADGGQR